MFFSFFLQLYEQSLKMFDDVSKMILESKNAVANLRSANEDGDGEKLGASSGALNTSSGSSKGTGSGGQRRSGISEDGGGASSVMSTPTKGSGGGGRKDGTEGGRKRPAPEDHSVSSTKKRRK